MIGDIVRSSNTKKRIAYISVACVYMFLLAVYGKELFMKLYSLMPAIVVNFIVFICATPSLILIGKATNLGRGKQYQEDGGYVLLLQLWRGEVRLFLAFWIYNLSSALLLIFLGQYAYLVHIKSSSIDLIAMIFIIALLVCMHALTIVGVWMSSKKYTGPLKWKAIARIGVIVTTVLTLIGLLLPTYGISMFQ